MPNLEPVLILPDCHVPYHDARAFDLVLKVARDLKPKHIVALGDFVDCYAVSSHSKDPKRTTRLDDELNEANCYLNKLDALGAKHKVFVEGNHEDRLSRYLRDKAPALDGLVRIQDVLRLKDRGWKFVPFRDDTKLGKVYITHNVGPAGRYSALKALDTYQHSVITGDSHRLSYAVEGNAVGEYRVTAQFGWLGDVNKVDWLHRVKARKNWALGFGVGYLDPKTGFLYLTPVPLVDYTVVVNGKLYSG